MWAELGIAVGALGFGVLTAAAQTWCLVAIEQRAAWRSTWWDIVISASSLVVIYTHDAAAFVTYMIGSALGTYWTVRQAAKTAPQA